MSIAPRRRLGALLLIAVVAVWSAPELRAQGGEKKAQKSLRVAVNDLVNTLQGDLKDTLKAFLIEVDAFDAQVKAGNYSTPLMMNLLDDLNDFQAGVATATDTGNSDLALAKRSILMTFDAADDLEGLFPADFYEGDGGTLDEYLERTTKALDKTYGKLRKRLAKTRARLESRADVALTFRIDQPFRQRVHVSGEGAVGSYVPSLAIDLLAGVSELGAADDGLLYAAGRASVAQGDVNVCIQGVGGPVHEADVSVAGSRWQHDVETPERSYAVIVQQGTGSFVIEAIGVR